MIRCRDAQAASTAYLDGDIDGDRANALRGHLRTCATCAERYAGEAAARDALRGLAGELEPSPALWKNVQRRLGEEEVADAGRSSGWFLSLWLRERIGPLSLSLCGAAACLALWFSIGRQAADNAPPAITSADSALPVAVSEPAVAVLSLEEERALEAAATEARYAGAAREVEALGGTPAPRELGLVASSTAGESGQAVADSLDRFARHRQALARASAPLHAFPGRR